MSPKYVVAFAVLSAAAAVGSASSAYRPAQLLLGWAAVSFAALAAAYAGAGPRLLGKRPDGRRAAWAWLLLGPYFLLNAAAFRLAVRPGRGPTVAEVAPNLWFGRRLSDRDARAAGVGWVAVLDLAAEFPEAPALRSVPGYRSLPVLDATPPSPAALRDAVEWLRERTAAGPVLVHCAMGHGRTGTVVVAYLIAAGEVADTAEGIARLRALRPGVDLNRRQRAVTGG